MNISQTPLDDKSENLLDMAQQLQRFVHQAAQQGSSLYETEKSILATVLRMGHLATDAFLQLQGDGDLGSTVQTEDGRTLVRSQQPVARPLRTVFGEHSFTAYVYLPGPKKQIALRPIDARLNLPAGKGSYLWEEFSQYFCIEQAFGQSAAALETVLGQKVSVDTCERTNRRLGEQAEQFLDTLPAPPPDEEGELLVATADGKGVPLIREQVDTAPVHGRKPPRPNNRRMATLACVYSVDPYIRTAEDIIAALFRDHRTEESSQEAAPRPRPCHKRMTACFSELADAGTENELRMRGDIRAWTWAAEQIETRRRDGQVLIRLCDGQPSLWDTSDICLGLDVEDSPDAQEVVDILDIIHVSGYVWLAARALCGTDEAAVERFVRERLLRILQGQASGVIAGMRRMASQRNLRGQKLKEATKACDYLAKNVARMRYDEYLAQGYPIASGVIEGACRHLVKDRMERTGMRWVESHAGRMLYLRAVFVTDLWEPFQTHRQAAEQARLHPHRSLLSDYTPAISLAL
jgi:hypothetical protein